MPAKKKKAVKKAPAPEPEMNTTEVAEEVVEAKATGKFKLQEVEDRGEYFGGRLVGVYKNEEGKELRRVFAGQPPEFIDE